LFVGYWFFTGRFETPPYKQTAARSTRLQDIPGKGAG
jgi:hypothetical protein